MGSFSLCFSFYGPWSDFLDVVPHLSDWKRAEGQFSPARNRGFYVFGDLVATSGGPRAMRREARFPSTNLRRGFRSSSVLR